MPASIIQNSVDIIFKEVEVGKIADCNLKSHPSGNKSKKKLANSKSSQNFTSKSEPATGVTRLYKIRSGQLPNSLDINESKPSKQIIQEMKSLDKFSLIKNDKINFCCDLLTQQIEILQVTLAEEALKSDDKVFVALAQLKRARDILKGTLKYQENHYLLPDD